MSDFTAINTTIVQFLSPFLPYLLKGGREAAKEAAKKVGEMFSEDAWEKAKLLWSKLRDNKKIKEAAKVASNLPDDEDAHAALRLQLKLLLQNDDNLRRELAVVIEQWDIVNYIQTDDIALSGKITGVKVKGKSGRIENYIKSGDVNGAIIGVSLSDE